VSTRPSVSPLTGSDVAQACGIRDEQLEMLAMLRYLEDCDLAGNQLSHVEYVQLLVSWVTRRARWVTLRACWVTLRAR
jgi:hypothetical protein